MVLGKLDIHLQELPPILDQTNAKCIKGLHIRAKSLKLGNILQDLRLKKCLTGKVKTEFDPQHQCRADCGSAHPSVAVHICNPNAARQDWTGRVLGVCWRAILDKIRFTNFILLFF